MASVYAMRIVHLPSGEYVQWAPGREQEVLIIDELVERVKVKQVGFLRTESQVLTAVREAVNELFLSIKKQV